jgi:serine/threonine protein kinase
MMSEVPADAGIRFGQYVLVRRIARGGMAEVFLAQQRGLEGFDRRVAVKRILPHLADSPDFVKMFLGEAKLAAQLSHPNVVHIYEFGKVEHDYFIAMEFVDGVHAGQLFKHGQEKDKDKILATLVARIGADAANALHYAHELRSGNGKLLGLVHRDVSPANIMVSFDGVVKLCDFGIAKAAAAGDQLTNPGQVKGKYAYMSPEQTIASGLDGRSDVFSLGVVMWELLTGKYIVPRGDAVAAMRAIRDGKLDPIEKVAPDVPAPLAKALTWALEPKREKRATAADFAQALEAFLKSAPELATSMQLGGWIRTRFVREGTGQMPAIPLGPGPGTQMSPGTFAAPGTAASAPGTLAGTAGARPITQGSLTPPAFPLRRVVKLLSDTGEGTEIYSTSSDLDEEAAETIKGARPPRPATRPPPNEPARPRTRTPNEVPPPRVRADRPRSNTRPPSELAQSGPTAELPKFGTPPKGPSRPTDPTAIVLPDHARASRAAEEPTVHAPLSVFGDATEVVRPAPDEEDSENHFETVLRDARTPIPSGPLVVPTRMGPALDSAARPRPASESARALLPDAAAVGSGTRSAIAGEQRRRNTPLPTELQRRKRKKLLVAIGGLGGLMLASFLIALAASSGKQPQAAAPPDAAPLAVQVDAALPIAPPPLDAALIPTVPIDAAAPVDEGMAYLIVRTIPDGGTIKVGDQSRVATVQPGDPSGSATAQLMLPPGKHVVTAELDGYRAETRTVVLDKGDNQRIEITFTKKLTTRPERGQPMGRLTVRTTPWSDVYEGSRKLGQAPFADLELPVGTHTLTFKNPSRPTVTRTVTIKAGKASKLNFNLP